MQPRHRSARRERHGAPQPAWPDRAHPHIIPPSRRALPPAVFFMLRNLAPPMRSWSMGLYGWLGCITLETCEPPAAPPAAGCACRVCCGGCGMAGWDAPRWGPASVVVGGGRAGKDAAGASRAAANPTTGPLGWRVRTWCGHPPDAPPFATAPPSCPADIGQFHTWLLSKRPDGQPIYLLTLLPGCARRCRHCTRRLPPALCCRRTFAAVPLPLAAQRGPVPGAAGRRLPPRWPPCPALPCPLPSPAATRCSTLAW